MVMRHWLYAALITGTLLGSRCNKHFLQERESSPAGEAQLQQEKLEMDNLAVLVVDMQDYFLRGSFLERMGEHTSEIEEELPYQLEILKAAKSKQLPIFVVEYADDWNTRYGATTEKIQRELQSYQGVQTLKKSTDDAFESTDLVQRLDEKRVQRLIIMGVNASSCVLETAVSAEDYGFEILTSRQVISDVQFPERVKQIPEYEEYGESAEWYRKYGTLFPLYLGLLEVIEAQ